MPGTVLTFAALPVAEAEAARRNLEKSIQRIIAEMVTIAPTGIDLQALYGAELISGMVDAVSGKGR